MSHIAIKIFLLRFELVDTRVILCNFILRHLFLILFLLFHLSEKTTVKDQKINHG